MENVLFEETLFHRGKWLWIIIGAPVLFTAVALPAVFLSGNEDFPGKVIAGAVALLIPLLFSAALWKTSLTTRITTAGVYVRYSPFKGTSRFIPLEDIDRIYVRDFSPLGEYGGWGLRFTPGERAYIISGKTGIQIVRKNGKKVLITTLKAGEAQEAINRLQS